MRSAPREVVLDRYTSHTAICPDSMRAYRAFSAARAAFGAAAALGAAVLAAYTGCAAAGGGADAGTLIRCVWCQLVMLQTAKTTTQSIINTGSCM